MTYRELWVQTLLTALGSGKASIEGAIFAADEAVEKLIQRERAGKLI